MGSIYVIRELKQKLEDSKTKKSITNDCYKAVIY